MAQVTAGVQHLIVNSVQFKAAESATYSVQTRKYESLVGAARHGVTAKGAAAFVEVEVFLTEGQASTDLVGLRGAEVSLVLLDRTVTLSAADFVGDGDVDGSKNSIKARFESASAREVF
jgi:hypothetical protein